MRRQRVDSRAERDLLVGLITSSKFLHQAVPVLERSKGTLRRSQPLFGLVSGWCLRYHRSYGHAPGKAIEAVYNAWADKEPDRELSDSAHDLLSGLSGDYTSRGLSTQFLLDTLGEFLTHHRLKGLHTEVESLLSLGKVKEAREAVTAFSKEDLSVGEDEADNALTEDAGWVDAYEDPPEPLLRLPGDAGKFLDREFTRDSFVAIQAPEKTGKSWVGIELAYQALRARRRVALFQVGDLSRKQIHRRLGTKFAELPTRAKKVRIPTKVLKDDEESVGFQVEYREEKLRACSWSEVKRARRDFNRAIGVHKRERLKLSVHSNGSINVAEIEAKLDAWRIREGFVPDVVVIDYADILKPEAAKEDEQSEIDATWRALRRLSQDWHCCVVTMTQAAASAYGLKTQTRKNFSRDKRKIAHVTAMLGLNQTDEEKEAQVMRFNWIVVRESDYSPRRCLLVGQCLDIGLVLACSDL